MVRYFVPCVDSWLRPIPPLAVTVLCELRSIFNSRRCDFLLWLASRGFGWFP